MPEPENQAPQDVPQSLPRAMRHQIARSEELQRELMGGTSLSGTTGDLAAPSPDAPPAGQTPLPTSGGAQPQQEPEETWEQRFKSLEGRYRNDVGRMSERVNQLERELTVRAQPPPQQVQPMSLLTPEEIEEYGPDFVDVVRRAATEAQAPLHGEIANLKAQLGATGRMVQVSANDRLHEYMNTRLPEWQDINYSGEFVAWSNLPDTYSGAIRKVLMQDAWDRGDGPRVEAFFRGFIAEQAALGARAPATPAGNGAAQMPNGISPQPMQPRVSLESLAAPGRTRSAPPVPADKPVYTRAQIAKFYSDVAIGRYKQNEQDRAAIDRDIMIAQHEGRIIDNPMIAAMPPPGFAR